MTSAAGGMIVRSRPQTIVPQQRRQFANQDMWPVLTDQISQLFHHLLGPSQRVVVVRKHMQVGDSEVTAGFPHFRLFLLHILLAALTQDHLISILRRLSQFVKKLFIVSRRAAGQHDEHHGIAVSNVIPTSAQRVNAVMGMSEYPHDPQFPVVIVLHGSPFNPPYAPPCTPRRQQAQRR